MLNFLKYFKRNIGSMCFYGNFCFTNSLPNFRTTYLKISIYVWQNSFQNKGTLLWNVSNLISVFRSKQFESINNPNCINLWKERNWFLALISDPYIFTTCLCKPLIFQASCTKFYNSLKYQMSTSHRSQRYWE